MDTDRSRRGFLQMVGAGALVTAAVPVGLGQLGCNVVPQHEVNPDGDQITLTLADYPELEVTGGMSILMVGDSTTLAVVRVADDGPDAFLTFDGLCTHAGCTLSGYDEQAEELYCNCHASSFDLDGEVTGGPAGTPLGIYPTAFDAAAGTVTIELG